MKDLDKNQNSEEENNIDLAAKQWFDLILATIQWQKEMKINKNEKLHD
jgi:hypothetical protein